VVNVADCADVDVRLRAQEFVRHMVRSVRLA
jgi:hypothetical protein